MTSGRPAREVVLRGTAPRAQIFWKWPASMSARLARWYRSRTGVDTRPMGTDHRRAQWETTTAKTAERELAAAAPTSRRRARRGSDRRAALDRPGRRATASTTVAPVFPKTRTTRKKRNLGEEGSAVSGCIREQHEGNDTKERCHVGEASYHIPFRAPAHGATTRDMAPCERSG